MTSHREWLEKTVEDVVDPHLAVVDCHHHFYRDREEYFDYQPDYVAGDLAEDLNDGHRVTATVCVEMGYGYRQDGPESLRSLGETEFILDCADSYRERKLGDTHVGLGVVPFIDLRLGDEVEDVILAHRELAGERLKGIRQMAARQLSAQGLERGPGLLQDRDFRAGLRHLEPHDLVFDVWIFHPQLPEFFDLAKQFPAITFVLNHFGAPLGIGPFADRREEVMTAWQNDMRQLSELHNVVVKLGGLNMNFNGFGWEQRPAPPTSDELLAATRDYYLRTIDWFTPERCLFESNFPIDKLSVSYRTLWNAYKKIAREFSEEEAEDLLSANAGRVYRLEPPE